VQSGRWRAADHVVPEQERCFEFFLNQLRLRAGVHIQDFAPRTGLCWSMASAAVCRARDKGLLQQQGQMLVPTEPGWRFVNETQALFLPPEQGF
jgi:oxygen-independent coproporphyrinogen-3 oxidase